MLLVRTVRYAKLLPKARIDNHLLYSTTIATTTEGGTTTTTTTTTTTIPVQTSSSSKHTDKPTGSGSNYFYYNDMDKNNKNAMDILATKGFDAAIEHMFIHPQTGKPMSYSQMRELYG